MRSPYIYRFAAGFSMLLFFITLALAQTLFNPFSQENKGTSSSARPGTASGLKPVSPDEFKNRVNTLNQQNQSALRPTKAAPPLPPAPPPFPGENAGNKITAPAASPAIPQAGQPGAPTAIPAKPAESNDYGTSVTTGTPSSQPPAPQAQPYTGFSPPPAGGNSGTTRPAQSPSQDSGGWNIKY